MWTTLSPHSAASLASTELYNAAFDLATQGLWADAHDLLVPATILQFAPLFTDAWQHGPLVTGAFATPFHKAHTPHDNPGTIELPYSQVPHAVTELMLLVAQAKHAEGVRLNSFAMLESGYAALKLVRLAYLSHAGADRRSVNMHTLPVTGPAGSEDRTWRSLHTRMELIASELLTAVLDYLNSATLPQLQAVAAEALDPMLSRCTARRDCLAAIVLARRLPLVIATGDVANFAPLERRRGHRMMQGALPHDEPLSLAGLLQEVLGYDVGLVPGRGGCVQAGQAKSRRVWRDMMHLDSERSYDLWSVAIASALLERKHRRNELPGQFSFLSPSGWVVCRVDLSYALSYAPPPNATGVLHAHDQRAERVPHDLPAV